MNELGKTLGKKLAIVAAGALFVGAGSLAHSNEYVLSYSANELTSAGGVQDLHARIVKAAKQYCPTYSQIRSNREVNACVEDVVNDLVSKVDHQRLSEYHAGDERFRVAGANDGGAGSS